MKLAYMVVSITQLYNSSVTEESDLSLVYLNFDNRLSPFLLKNLYYTVGNLGQATK